MSQIFPQILCWQVSVIIILGHWIVFKFYMHVHNLNLHSNYSTLDYFPKKFLKYANAAEMVKIMSVAPFFPSLGTQK